MSSFLAKYQNITNTLACIVRSFEGIDYLRILAAVGVIIGTHLIEPYLSLTSSSTTSWEQLMTVFPTLYTDLTSVKPALLLDLTKPALSFVSEERFSHCLYSADLLQPTILIIESFRSEVISVLNILLPNLAKGWARQRGKTFGFGDTPLSEASIAKFDQEKLAAAPISNLDSERSVGSINYELKLRGAKQLKMASSALVKSRCSSQISNANQKLDRKFLKMTESGGEVPAIMKEWEERQKELMKKGLEEKEIANINIDQQRNSDLQKLVELHGPFTGAQEVEVYMAREDVGEVEKGKRLYLEVRHAKNSSISFPKVSEIFRLKKDYKNLSNEVYAKNLMVYLKRISSCVEVDMSDFKEALKMLEK